METKTKPDYAAINSMFAEALNEQGYIVIGTKPNRHHYEIGQFVFELFGYPQDFEYRVTAIVGEDEYNAQLLRFAELRPQFPWGADKSDRTGAHFYRVVKVGHPRGPQQRARMCRKKK